MLIEEIKKVHETMKKEKGDSCNIIRCSICDNLVINANTTDMFMGIVNDSLVCGLCKYKNRYIVRDDSRIEEIHDCFISTYTSWKKYVKAIPHSTKRIDDVKSNKIIFVFGA